VTKFTTVAQPQPLRFFTLDFRSPIFLSITHGTVFVCLLISNIPSPSSLKFVTIVLTFSLKIILRQFLSPFHKDYLTTNFNLTTKIILMIKKHSLGVLDTTLCSLRLCLIKGPIFWEIVVQIILKAIQRHCSMKMKRSYDAYILRTFCKISVGTLNQLAFTSLCNQIRVRDCFCMFLLNIYLIYELVNGNVL
jgi:uncharacterized membrane protein